MTETAAAFVFLRPMWLLALLALPLLVWALRHRRRASSAWQRAVDPHLLPHLLHVVGGRESHGALWLLLLGGALAILALAGPSWRQAATPLFQVQSPLVIALDLSSAMRAADLPPSRLIQARAKLASLLDARRGGQVGLLAYADDAYTVAPITRDAKTVKALLESLSPDIMPVDGQRADRAIAHAVELMRSAKFERGEILLVSDRTDAVARAAAAKARAAGFRISVLGVGTATGAPVSGPEGFVKDADGKLRIARLDAASLRQLANSGGGGFAVLTQDLADLESLGVLDPQGRAEEAADAAGAAADAGAARAGGVRRVDQGYWLLLALLPIVLLGFRRSWLVMLPLAVSLGVLSPVPSAHAQAPAPRQAPAVEQDDGFAWESLWKRPDQRAREALEKGETQQARALARDPSLSASAAYRGEDYESAAETWESLDNADAQYNRGNALAKAGKLEDALSAYDEALTREPGMPDAVANRKIVEDALKQQQQQQQQQQGDKGVQQQQDRQQQDQQQQGDQQQDQQGEQQDGQQPQEGDNQGGEQQPNEGEQDGEPRDGEEEGKEPGDSGESESDKSSEGEQPSEEQNPNDQPGTGDQKKAAKPEDAKLDPEAQAQQQRADEQAKREMEQALQAAQQQEGEGKEGEQSEARAPLTAEERAEEEQRQSMERWLRRVPDDPGGLLRRKFALEHQRRQSEGRDQ